MLHLRIYSPSQTTDAVMRALEAHPQVSSLALLRGASVRPPGDVVLADVPREAANAVIDALHDTGVANDGTIQLDPVDAWLSRPALNAERDAPGAGADSVVWAEVVERAYSDSELNWTYLTFMTLATLIASVAIVLDSQILVIGAMVLGPEFGVIAALGVALVRRRMNLLALAGRSLVVGFAVSIAVTAALAAITRVCGWVSADQVSGDRTHTSFIYEPGGWSLVVAVIAAAAGVLSLTSDRLGGLSGVFISVTTIPAAGNIAVGAAFGLWDEVDGSALQLLINVSGMAVAGWLTLVLHRALWSRVPIRRSRWVPRWTPPR